MKLLGGLATIISILPVVLSTPIPINEAARTVAAPLIVHTPPNVPSTATAKTLLASLTVAAQGTQSGYRYFLSNLFPCIS